MWFCSSPRNVSTREAPLEQISRWPLQSALASGRCELHRYREPCRCGTAWLLRLAKTRGSELGSLGSARPAHMKPRGRPGESQTRSKPRRTCQQRVHVSWRCHSMAPQLKCSRLHDRPRGQLYSRGCSLLRDLRTVFARLRFQATPARWAPREMPPLRRVSAGAAAE